MFSDLAEEYVRQAIVEETASAKSRYGATYASGHEGYAILKEEVEEVRDAKIQVQNHLYEMWSAVKVNDAARIKRETIYLKNDAVKLALEAVQVCAVCEKLLKSI